MHTKLQAQNAHRHTGKFNKHTDTKTLTHIHHKIHSYIKQTHKHMHRCTNTYTYPIYSLTLTHTHSHLLTHTHIIPHTHHTGTEI